MSLWSFYDKAFLNDSSKANNTIMLLSSNTSEAGHAFQEALTRSSELGVVVMAQEGKQ